jgi:dTDP-4-dehydrorhamnose reductase
MTRTILVTGAGGQVGHELAITDSLHRLLALTRAQLDIANPERVTEVFDTCRPDIVINAAAYTQVDRAEEEPASAFAINRDGVSNLANACDRTGIPLLHISTDYVFDGKKSAAYVEDDEIAQIGRAHV